MKKLAFLFMVCAIIFSSCNKYEEAQIKPTPVVGINDTVVINDNPETPSSQAFLPGQLSVNVMTLDITPKCDATLGGLITNIMPTGTATPGYSNLSSLKIFNENIQIGSTMAVTTTYVMNSGLNFQMKKDVKYRFTFVVDVSSSATPGTEFQLAFGAISATDKDDNLCRCKGGTTGNIMTIKQSSCSVDYFDAKPDTIKAGEHSIIAWSTTGCTSKYFSGYWQCANYISPLSFPANYYYIYHNWAQCRWNAYI